MFEVRTATLADLETLVDFGKRLTQESPNFSKQGLHEPTVRAFLSHLIEYLQSVFLVYDTSHNPIGALIGETGLCWRTGHVLAFEHGVYVLPEHRKSGAAAKLVQHYIEWVKSQGANRIQLGTMSGIHANKTVQFYEHLGLKLTGYVLEKEINHV